LGFQTYLCPLCAGRHYVELGGEGTAALGAMVGKLNSKHARSVLRSTGRRGVPKMIKVRTVKKLAKRLSGQGRDDFAADQPRMLGALIVEHTDGQKTRFIAQSGGEDLDLRELEGKYYVAKEYIDADDPYLPRLFGGTDVRNEHLSLSEDDFTTNCAAMKMFIALSKAIGAVRAGGGRGKLASNAPIAKLTLAEEIYRPFTAKLPKNWRQYTRGEFDDPSTTHLAPSCHRCRQKIPALLCPVAKAKSGKLQLFESARTLVEHWETDYHSQPWGKRKKEYVSRL